EGGRRRAGQGIRGVQVTSRVDAMKQVDLSRASEQVQQFIRSLPIERDGCILVVDGKPLLKVVPLQEVVVDRVKLKAAIRRRRDESRKLNEEWEAVDQEVWEKIADNERRSDGSV